MTRARPAWSILAVAFLASSALCAYESDTDPDLGARADPYSAPLSAVSGIVTLPFHQDPVYGLVANIELGTPPQQIRALVNTGLSDFLVQTDLEDECSSGQVESSSSDNCVTWGQAFNYNESATWSANSSGLSVLSAVLSVSFTAEGQWGTDMLSFGSLASPLDRATVGVVYNYGDGGAVLGLGPQDGELSGTSMENGVVSPTYNNTLSLLKYQGHINSLVYSLWSDRVSSNGVVYFGGIDHSRYTGALSLVPIVGYIVGSNRISQVPDGRPLSLRFMLHGIRLSKEFPAPNCPPDFDHPEQCGPQIGWSFSLPIALQSSQLYTVVPAATFDALNRTLGLTTVPDYLVSASNCTLPGSLTFNFSGVPIEVPLQAFILDPLASFGTNLTFAGGTPACIFSILPSVGNYLQLAASITQYMYSVIDLESFKLALAPSRPGNATSNSNVTNTNTSRLEAVTAGWHNISHAPLYSMTAVNSTIASWQLNALETHASLPLSGAGALHPHWILLVVCALAAFA